MRSFFSIESLIPQALDAYRALILAAFETFLAMAPPERAVELVAAQQSLPTDATSETRLVACMRCCPTLHKLGQVLARDKRLSQSLRTELQSLESLPSDRRVEEVRPVVERELGDAIQQYEIRLGPAALAEGSVAIAWPLTWRAPGETETQQAVAKIPHAGIRDRVAGELVAIGGVADLIASQADRFGVNPDACRDVFDKTRRLLLRELDAPGEQANLVAAGRQYRANPKVRVPALTPFCTTDITAMSRLGGTKITDVHDASSSQRKRLAEHLVEAIFAQPAFASDCDALFHGDPHAGNILRMEDECVGLLDWSLAARLDADQRRSLAQMFIAGLTLDASELARRLAAFASGRPSEPATRNVAEASIAEIDMSRGVGVNWLLATLDRAALAGLPASADALILRKSLHTLTGVVEDVAPSMSIDQIVMRHGLSAFGSELGARGFAWPTQSDFGVRLSNMDLWRACMSASLTPLRYWRNTLMRIGNRADEPRR
ncbi:MAG TPA: AarF/UbiB family protein [Phycisphaerae bacterium]|nr:AarF/UbiB family protein [Phycisphaerae bacterium]HRW54261.1 AarF/UbiB family protein [Phycisphaerae bacterium]